MSKLRKTGSTSAWRQLRQRVLQRDHYSCVICGQDEGKLEIDHIQRRADNGTDDLDNLQTLCQACHINKTKQEAIFSGSTATPPYPLSNLSPKGTMKTLGGDFG